MAWGIGSRQISARTKGLERYTMAATPAERARRHRARRRNGVQHIVSIDVYEGEVLGLVMAGYLDEQDTGNREAVSAAVVNLFCDTLQAAIE